MAMTNKLFAVQAAIKTALEAITDTDSAYNYDLNDVKFGTPDLDQVVGGLPEVFIQSISEAGIVRPGNTVRKRTSFTIVGITGSDMRFADIGTETLKLAADIEKALTTDLTLGTVVDYTQHESTSVTYFGDASKGAVTMEFFCEYQVVIGTP